MLIADCIKKMNAPLKWWPLVLNVNIGHYKSRKEALQKEIEGKSHFARLVQCKDPVFLCLSPENEGYKAILLSDTYMESYS